MIISVHSFETSFGNILLVFNDEISVFYALCIQIIVGAFYHIVFLLLVIHNTSSSVIAYCVAAAILPDLQFLEYFIHSLNTSQFPIFYMFILFFSDQYSFRRVLHAALN